MSYRPDYADFTPVIFILNATVKMTRCPDKTQLSSQFGFLNQTPSVTVTDHVTLRGSGDIN